MGEILPFPVRGWKDHTLLFLHIPKTAGTSLSLMLCQQFPPDQIFHIRGNKRPDAPYFSSHFGPEEEFQALPESQRARYRCILGHFSFGLHEWVPGPSTYLTILREPLERQISMYRQYARMAHSKNCLSLEEFLSSPRKGKPNHQIRHLTGWKPQEHTDEEMIHQARTNLNNHFCAVGTVDRLPETVAVVAKLFGWKDVILEKENVSKKNAVPTDLSEEFRQTLQQQNYLDQWLCQYVDQRLQQQLADLHITPEDYPLNRTQLQPQVPFLRFTYDVCRKLPHYLKQRLMRWIPSSRAG